MKILISLVLVFCCYLCEAQNDTLKRTGSDSVGRQILKDSIIRQVVKKDTGIIKITITDINASKKGWLFAGLYNPGTFLKKDPFRKFAAEVKGTQMSFQFDSVPKGYYAVAAIQDINRNEKLDANNIGIPTEGFAFSNNAIGNFGPPVFIDCRFYFNGKYKSMVIKMVYMFNK
jgi:uncharacterized protein (DUF2141 family)